MTTSSRGPPAHTTMRNGNRLFPLPPRTPFADRPPVAGQPSPGRPKTTACTSKAVRDRHPLHRVVHPPSVSVKHYGPMVSAIDVWGRIRAAIAERDREIRALRAALGPPWRGGQHRRPALPRNSHDWLDIAHELGIRRKRPVVDLATGTDRSSGAARAAHRACLRRQSDQKHRRQPASREISRQPVRARAIFRGSDPEIDTFDLKSSKKSAHGRPQPRRRLLGTI